MNRVVLAVCWVVGSSVACDPSPKPDASAHELVPSGSATAATIAEPLAAAADGGAAELVAIASPPVPMPSPRPAASAAPPTTAPVVTRTTAVAAASPVAPATAARVQRVADPIDVPPPRAGVGSLPAATAGHICFSWRRGHASSTQCYASVESCNAERRAAPAAEELTRCQPRMRASCTVVETDLGRQRHCFGDAARCEVFRGELDPTERSTPCSAN